MIDDSLQLLPGKGCENVEEILYKLVIRIKIMLQLTSIEGAAFAKLRWPVWHKLRPILVLIVEHLDADLLVAGHRYGLELCERTQLLLTAQDHPDPLLVELGFWW